MAVLSAAGRSFEIIFVEDAGGDTSWDVVRELRKQHPDHIVAMQLMRNFGQHNAIMCGLRHARGSLIVTMDDDLQNPPEEIPKLVAAIEETGHDLIYGVPERKRHTRWRNLGSDAVLWFYETVFRTGVRPTSFRIMSRPLVEGILTYDLNYTYLDGLFAWNTQRIGAVTVEHQDRAIGRSGYSLRKLLLLAVNLFANFSLLPLQIVSVVGTLAALGGFMTGAFYLVKFLIDGIAVPGFASIIIAVLTLGGIQLLALGIMGEYLGRLHLNVNRKPQYAIREVLVPAGYLRKPTGLSEVLPAMPQASSVKRVEV